MPGADLADVISELRANNEPVPRPLRLPTDAEVTSAEAELGVEFPRDYRRWLLEASDVVFGTKEPCVITLGRPGHMDLLSTAREAWELGVPRDWLPFCEDNGDYFCLDGDRVLFWSHDGATDESWPNLATWISEVWIGEG